jgi:hypothetical protein
VRWPRRFLCRHRRSEGTGPQSERQGYDWDLYLGPAPWLPYDGSTGPHRFDIGELNWGQHHYDIVQWPADADNEEATRNEAARAAVKIATALPSGQAQACEATLREALASATDDGTRQAVLAALNQIQGNSSPKSPQPR